MSIAVLTQVSDEVRRLAIAGSVVAPGDFRLKKLVPPLEQAGAKAPVFAKVAEAASRLIESKEQTSAAALLELTTLVNAILYTQGETGIQGQLQPLATIDFGRPKTQASARVLKPLQEALTTTGSGRVEIIREGFERGAFGDLRLIGPSLTALDDKYAEIADFIAEKVLPLYGRAIWPELEATFIPKGRTGHARRLRLMHHIDAEAARPHVQQALEEGSKEVRIAAIGCLGDSPDDLPFLLEQVKAKAEDVRTAAFEALGNSGADDAVNVLCAAMQSADLNLAIEPIRVSRSRALTSILLEATGEQFETLLTTKEKDSKKLGKLNERMRWLLECLRGRDDKQTEKLLLGAFARVELLAAIKGEPSGKDVVERLVSVMADGSDKVRAALVAAHRTLPAESLNEALMAAVRCCTPAKLFEEFSPYLTAKVDEKKKNRDPAYAKREVIITILSQGGRRWYGDPDAFDPVTVLDPRWLDLAIQLERTDLVESLATPGHTKANAFLSRTFKQRIAKSSIDHELSVTLRTMARIGHPEATDAMIALIQKSVRVKHAYSVYWISNMIPLLPKSEAVPKLEALLPTLPEKFVDQLLDYLTELKEST